MSNRKKIKRSPYVEKLADAALKVPAGQVGWLRVEHDDHCDKLKDLHADCTCVPNVRFVPAFPEAKVN